MGLFYLYGLVFMVLVVKSGRIVIKPLYGEALLHCDSKVKRDACHRIRWVKYATGVRSIILSWPKTLTFPDAERVELSPDGNGTHSLSLTKLQKSDEGLYSCEIWSGWNCIEVQNTSLKIKECKILPAVKAMQGSSVNLSCPLDETAATQRGAADVSWVMLKAVKTVPVTSQRAEISGSSLSFRSVGKKDTSWYRCSYKQEQAQRCYDINLQVQGQGQDLPSGTEINSRKENEENEEAEAPHSSRPVVAAVTVVLLAVVVAVALAGFFLHHRRNRQTAVSQTQRHQTGAGSDYYTNCETMDCAIYKQISIYQEIPANLAGN